MADSPHHIQVYCPLSEPVIAENISGVAEIDGD
jgi:hypothetical protein